jgi:hypothetical protein
VLGLREGVFTEEIKHGGGEGRQQVKCPEEQDFIENLKPARKVCQGCML